jgi:hypothetical protein
MLLPVTTPIPNAPDWSIAGVISYAKSEDKNPIVRYFCAHAVLILNIASKVYHCFLLQLNMSVNRKLLLLYA